MSSSVLLPTITILSESAVAVTFGETIDLETHRKALAFRDRVLARPIPGLISVSPAYASVTVFFDPRKVRDAMRGSYPDPYSFSPATAVRNFMEDILNINALYDNNANKTAPEPIDIPVCYDGPDLSEVAERLNITVGDVIRLHSDPVYIVFMNGFLPGFPYLGPLPAALELPRRDSPRLRVPPGSVAIAGRQTGIYPQASPGGWHLIGSTDFELFDPQKEPPARLRPGMRVRFKPR